MSDWAAIEAFGEIQKAFGREDDVPVESIGAAE